MRWEYRAQAFEPDRDSEAAIYYIQRNYPEVSWKELPKYDLLLLEAWLNEMGVDGWELVSVEPVERIGKNGDLGNSYPEMGGGWRKVYFCVFKRGVE